MLWREPSDTIGDVKQEIQKQKGYDPESQQLYFGSKLLDDDNTIADYNIQRGDSIRLVLKESHHYSSEWSMDGQSHWHACTDDGCDAKADEAKHSDTNKDHKCDVRWELRYCGCEKSCWFKTFCSKSSDRKWGRKYRILVLPGCEKHYKDAAGTQKITKAGTVQSPKTADTTNLMLWSGLLFVSGSVASYTMLSSRKKQNSRK